MEAVILCGGEGSRVAHISKGHPKCLIQLGVVGFNPLQRIVHKLEGAGFTHFYVVCKPHHIHEIRECLRYLNVSFQIHIQEFPNGPADALMAVKGKVLDRFLVCYGDTVFEDNLNWLKIHQNYYTALLGSPQTTKSGGITTIHGGYIRKMDENEENPQKKLVSTGVFTFGRAIFDYLPQNLSIPGAIMDMTNDNRLVRAYITNKFWGDCGTEEGLQIALDYYRGKGLVR